MSPRRARPAALLVLVAAAACDDGAYLAGGDPVLHVRTGERRVLHLPQRYQEGASWCWAAVTQAVLEYYGHDVSQQAIADVGTGGLDVWNHTDGIHEDAHCGGGICRGIDELLKRFMETPVRVPVLRRALDDEEIRWNVASLLRPFVVLWSWDGGGGHFVVAHGVEQDASEDAAYLYLMDPWNGPTYADASWVRKGGGHTWTQTVLLDAPAPPPRADVDGCGVMPWGHGLGWGQTLWSCDGHHALAMQADGDLVLHHAPRAWAQDGWTAAWSSGTVGRGDYAMLHEDGRLAVHASVGDRDAVSWATPAGLSEPSLVVTDGGDLVIRDGRGGAARHVR